MRKTKTKKPTVSMATLAVRAMRRAAEKVLEKHRRFGVPIAVWRNGKVVRIPASRIRLRKASSR